MSDNKPLLIIGNGFDLHLGLKSSFNDFFKNEILNVDNIVFDIIFSSDTGFMNHDNDSVVNEFNLFNDFKDLRNKEFFDSVELMSIVDGVISNYGLSNDGHYIKYDVHKELNFWSLYFRLLETASNESVINKKNFNDWNDIESQIYFLLVNSSDFLEFYYDSYLDLLYEDDYKKYYDDYTSRVRGYVYDKYGHLSEIGIIRLMSIYLMLYSGWEPDEQNVYDFLFQELQSFENQFLAYLSNAVNDLTDYKELAQKFANELADAESYKLINFNYTDFYALNDPNSYNIHSTLSNHPIFGIGDNENSGLSLSNKPYYMFTKTYRIMTLANNDVVNNTLSPDVNQIIFYGHSLSDADYAYFQSLFDYYDIYNSDVQLLFKYSIISDSPNKDVQRNINSIYKLINRYGADRNQGNLLNKLIMGNRLKLDRV